MKMSFMQVGMMLQETAQTREEARKRFCDSCNKCWKAGTCVEMLCPIAKLHTARMNYFDAVELASKMPEHEHELKVRKYNTSPNAQIRGRIKKLLNRVHEAVKGTERELDVDQAEVYNEDERFEDVIYILNRASLKKLAKHVAKLAGLAKED